MNTNKSFDFEQIYHNGNIKIYIENTWKDEKDVLHYENHGDITFIKDAVIKCDFLMKDDNLEGNDCEERIVDYFNKYDVQNKEKGLTCVALELLFPKSEKIKIKNELISKNKYMKLNDCKPLW